jgi:ABC-type Fe3+-hydroxamate transport system substrate-binding protein
MKKSRILTGILGMLILTLAILTVSCEEEKLFTCNNRSSYTVTVTNANGDGITIAPGSTKSIYLLGDTTLNDIYYSPANLVSVSLSGQTITFRDR